ncbi:MAG: Do family serine endopeptidase [Lentimicrobiaceae bacterium]|nr:Do family serine endopeptidase [Lentimicrobiaceae bacterium]
MKKYVLAILMAVAGGMISLGAYSLINKEQTSRPLYVDQPQVQMANYVPGTAVTGPDFTNAANMTVHAVVHIKTEYERKSSVYDNFFNDFFNMDPFGGQFQNRVQPIEAFGSGVIISQDGYIVTNNHVVQEAEKISVTLNDKRTFTAEIIGTDPTSDLALIKVEAKNLPYLQFGNSDNVRVGEWVLAVGNPFNLTSTVTAGIVSAKARNINILGIEGAIESYIQTDAAVNKGNSGGALVNGNGELIGVNAAIASNTGSYAGYSFAIPSNIAKKITDDLMKYGEVQRAYIGVSIREIDGNFAEKEGLDGLRGVYVNDVTENGAAKDAGVKTGDVIISIDNVETNSTAELLERVAQYSPGAKVDVQIIRSGKTLHLSLTLKNKEGNTELVKTESKDVISVLGAEFESISKDEANRLGIKNGLKIIKIGKGKLSEVGIREGFIIIAVDKKPIRTADDIYTALKDREGGVLIEGIYPNRKRAWYGFGM